MTTQGGKLRGGGAFYQRSAMPRAKGRGPSVPKNLRPSPHQRPNGLTKDAGISNFPGVNTRVHDTRKSNQILHGDRDQTGRYETFYGSNAPAVLAKCFDTNDNLLSVISENQQEAQLMLTTGSKRLAVSRGQQTWYHSTCYI